MIDKDHPLVPKNPDGVARIIVLGRLSEPNETEAETLATIESSLAAAVGSQPNSAAPTHRLLANSGARLWGKSPNVTFVQDTNGNSIWQMQTFWGHTAEMMRTLERLSRKELAGEPFTVEESGMLRKTIASKESGDRDYDHSRDYSGWYCQLLYPRPDGIDKWHPTVADVHTDPNGAEILEVGVGRTDLIVVAIDNGADRMAFVGPIYAYYEFKQPGPDRMTDEEFARRLERHDSRVRQPAWLGEFGR